MLRLLGFQHWYGQIESNGRYEQRAKQTVVISLAPNLYTEFGPSQDLKCVFIQYKSILFIGFGLLMAWLHEE